MASQTMLFETDTRDNGDGSFTIRPKAVRIEREIGTKRAMRILGFSKYEVHRLCQLGEEYGGINAYKHPTMRGNGHWKIDWQSVMTYKARRMQAAR
jgi:hypothetical protein